MTVAPGTADGDGTSAVADAVGPVYPNPSASGRATVEVSVATAQAVRVSVVDVLGREVSVAYDGDVAPGAPVRVELMATDRLAPRTYVVRIEGATLREARQFTVTR